MSAPLRQHALLAQFPLVKYSHAETSFDKHGAVHWTHVQSTDLNVIFEKDINSISSSTMASFQQRLRLRVVRGREQLEDLDLQNLAREATQQAITRQTKNTKPSVAVLVKDPCLAVRFPSGREQIHRFQLKFASSRDYCDTLEILREINCPFSETSAEHNSRSASSRLDSSSSRITNPTIPAFRGSVEWGQLNDAVSNRSWNQGLLRSHTILGASSPNPLISDLQARNQIPTTPTPLDMPRKDVHTFSQMVDPQASKLERPITAPAFDSYTLEQVLPPKRNLPFSKPGPRSSHVQNQSSINGSSRLGMLPELTPNAQDTESIVGIPTASSRPPSARSRMTLPATSSSTRQNCLELEDSRRVLTSQEKEQPVRKPIPAASPVLGSSFLGVSSPETNITNTTSTHYTSDGQLSTKHPPELSLIGHEKSPIASSQQQEPPPSRLSPRAPLINNATTISTNRLTSNNLSAYLITPETERSQLVNNWICQQLEDDGFHALCQDVERVWQRIAFGNRGMNDQVIYTLPPNSNSPG